MKVVPCITRFLRHFVRLLLLLYLTGNKATFFTSCTSIPPRSCDEGDDHEFSFGSFPFNGKDVERTCAWLTSNPDKIKIRKDTWCEQAWPPPPSPPDDKPVIPGIVVGEKCIVSCGRCDKFVPPPPDRPCKEGDDNFFTFGKFDFNGQTITRDCEWLRANDNAIEKRFNRWCKGQSDPSNNIIVRDKCIVSCARCGDPNPRTCDEGDDPDFVFGSFDFQGQQIKRTCDWITSNPDKIKIRKDTWCPDGKEHPEVKGIFINDKCVETCGKCDNRRTARQSVSWINKLMSSVFKFFDRLNSGSGASTAGDTEEL